MPPTVVTVRNAGKVATALSNEKCQKILSYLMKHDDATETGLARALVMPLSTVHYNMKILVESKLAIPDTYSYSSRGKEVLHYRVNKNPIVIVQEESHLSLLKAIVPAVLVTAGGAVIYQLMHTSALGPEYAARASEAMVASDAAPEFAMKAAPMMAQTVGVTQTMAANPVPAFILGAVSVLLVSYCVLLLMRWREKQQP